MNESKSAPVTKKIKNEKVGADGLSKKERRALKVAEKAKNDSQDIEVAPASIENVSNSESNIDSKSLLKKEQKEAKMVKRQAKKEQKVGGVEENQGEMKIVEKQSKEKLVKKQSEEKCIEKQGENKSVKKQSDEKKIEEKSIGQKKVINVIKTQEINVKAQEKKAEPDENGTETKSKAQLKAERRELQEKQRQAKLAAKENKIEIKNEPQKNHPLKLVTRSPKKDTVKRELLTNQVQLFNHLYLKQISIKEKIVINQVHPSFIRLGAQYASKTILGSNARCLALLSALKDLIEDFQTPQNAELCRSLESYLQTSAVHLQKCRPFAVSMTNALRHFKVHSTQIPTQLTDIEKKSHLIKIVDTYIEDQIHTAGKAISMKVSKKISNGDVILTYGCSSLIKKILSDARIEGKSFRVIVVDGRPFLEGREMLRKLISAGIDCTYVLINAVSFIMGQATKVLLGAHALLANGYVMARTGTAQVALIAQTYNKPVLVCCETYKFCERVQTDSFVYNEIGDPDKIVGIDTAENESPLKFAASNNVTPLNLMYDVTPPDLVTAVVTELGFLPCTSVPVILRIKPTE